jgi:hypothetical protein
MVVMMGLMGLLLALIGIYGQSAAFGITLGFSAKGRIRSAITGEKAGSLVTA